METLIHVGGRMNLLPNEVAYFEADTNYTIIHYRGGGKKIVATTLGRISERIGVKNGFIRPNRSFFINLEFINQINLGEILLIDNLRIHISRRRKEELIPIVESHIENKNSLSNF